MRVCVVVCMCVCVRAGVRFYVGNEWHGSEASEKCRCQANQQTVNHNAHVVERWGGCQGNPVKIFAHKWSNNGLTARKKLQKKAVGMTCNCCTKCPSQRLRRAASWLTNGGWRLQNTPSTHIYTTYIFMLAKHSVSIWHLHYLKTKSGATRKLQQQCTAVKRCGNDINPFCCYCGESCNRCCWEKMPLLGCAMKYK